MSKVVAGIRDAVIKCGLRDGMCISFHHHLRNGDYVMNMVLKEIADLGLHNLALNVSAIQDIHMPLVEYVKQEVITEIETDYISAEVGRELSKGILKTPVKFRTHGNRASAVLSGESVIDVAFIAAPTADTMGNMTGKTGPSACGSMGYAFADAQSAEKVVVITDNLVVYPLEDFSIAEEYVDYVVKVERIGDPAGIVSGTTKMPKDPVALKIASLAAKTIEASGLLVDGFSFQTGAGGASLAVAAYLKDIMVRKQIKGSFALGGITGYLVDMLEAGCFQSIMDVQCFDLQAVASLKSDPRHQEISGNHYAGSSAKSSAAASLDVVVLGATQIDVGFNVNVHTDSNNYIIGGSGGHTDVAACAKMTIIVAPLSRARTPIVVDKVLCVSTPGKYVDVLVTQYGIAVNPNQKVLRDRLSDAGLPVMEIQQMKVLSDQINGVPDEVRINKNRVVAEVLDRDGSLLDLIYAVEKS